MVMTGMQSKCAMAELRLLLEDFPEEKYSPTMQKLQVHLSDMLQRRGSASSHDATLLAADCPARLFRGTPATAALFVASPGQSLGCQNCWMEIVSQQKAGWHPEICSPDIQ
jgi:hypothetical protein